MAREKELWSIITFHTTADALAFKTLCKRRAIEGRLVAIPHQLSASCGMAWKSPITLHPVLEDLVETEGLDVEGIHKLMLP